LSINRITSPAPVILSASSLGDFFDVHYLT